MSRTQVPARPHLERRLAVLAAKQHQVVTAADLRRLGLRRGAVEHRLAVGRLHRVHVGVYAVVPPSALTRHARAYAAVRACGDGAVLSHEAAAALWGLGVPWPARPTVTVAGRRVRRPGVHAHATAHFARGEVRHRDGIAVASPLRTLLDLAAVLDPRGLHRVVDEALLHGLVGERQLRAAAVRAGSRPGAPRLRAFLDDRPSGRSESVHEEHVLDVVRRAGLQLPARNVVVCGHRVDCWWAEARVVVEADGRRVHERRTTSVADRRKDAHFTDAGLRFLRVHPEDLRGDALLETVARLGRLVPPARRAPRPRR